MIQVTRELQEALLYKLHFIESLTNLGSEEIALREIKDLIRELEKGEITPF